MQKKHVRMVIGLSVGVCAAAAEEHWPAGAATIQMGFYSAMCLGPLLIGMWSYWRRADYWIGILVATAAHAAFLYLARSLFPFKSVLAIIPMALLEVAVLFVIVLKTLRD